MTDAPGWCEVRVVGRDGRDIARWVLSGNGTPDLSTVDRLARLELDVRTTGGHLVVQAAHPGLLELLHLSGLRQTVSVRFRDRTEAGRELSRSLAEMDLVDPVILGLPRGGVPVAAVVAAERHGTLDVLIARKVGAPGHAELGVGAVAEGGGQAVDRRGLGLLGITEARFAELVAREQQAVEQAVAKYRDGRPLPGVQGRDVVVVDDGLATGVTAEAALSALRPMHPCRLVLAVPVCPPETRDRLATLADDVVCVTAPRFFRSVGEWYDNFSPTSDEEVLRLLRQARERRPPGAC